MKKCSFILSVVLCIVLLFSPVYGFAGSYEYKFDQRGRLTESISPNGDRFGYQYDLNGNLLGRGGWIGGIAAANGSFEETVGSGSGPSNWGAQSSGGAQVTFEHRADGGFDGSRYMRLSNSSGVAAGVFGRLYQYLDVQPDTTYIISIRARSHGTHMASFGGGELWDIRYPFDTSTNGKWKEFKGNFTTGPNQTSWHFMILVESVTQQLDIDAISVYPIDSGKVLKNWGFESPEVSGAKPIGWEWQVSGGAQATLEYRLDGGYEGYRYIRLKNTSGVAAGVFGRLYQHFAVQPNTTYTVSLRARTVNVHDAQFGGGTAWDIRYPIAVNTNGKWQEFKGNFTTGANETSWHFMVLVQGITGQLDVDSIELDLD